MQYRCTSAMPSGQGVRSFASAPPSAPVVGAAVAVRAAVVVALSLGAAVALSAGGGATIALVLVVAAGAAATDRSVQAGSPLPARSRASESSGTCTTQGGQPELILQPLLRPHDR